MKHQDFPKAILLSFLLMCFTIASGQTPATVNGYDAEKTYNRIKFLRGKHLEGLEGAELEELCRQAIKQQDVKSLVVLASFDTGNVRMQALKGVPTLPIPAQKQILVSLLGDDQLWNYDRVHGLTRSGFGEGQLQEQLAVRSLVGRVLGRDLRQSSKHYNPDIKKQQSAETFDAESAILDVATREQLANELQSR